MRNASPWHTKAQESSRATVPDRQCARESRDGPMHATGALDCPLVAVQAEHQDVAAKVFDSLVALSRLHHARRVSACHVASWVCSANLCCNEQDGHESENGSEFG